MRRPNAHPTLQSKFLLSSELCGTCHRFGHPVSGLAIQDTYDEWKRSPYAAEGKRCQDCHMPAYSGKTAVDGKDRPELHAHVFMGGHTEMIRKAASVGLQSNWKDGRKETLERCGLGFEHRGRTSHSRPAFLASARCGWKSRF